MKKILLNIKLLMKNLYIIEFLMWTIDVMIAYGGRHIGLILLEQLSGWAAWAYAEEVITSWFSSIIIPNNWNAECLLVAQLFCASNWFFIGQESQMDNKWGNTDHSLVKRPNCGTRSGDDSFRSGNMQMFWFCEVLCCFLWI